MSDVVAELRGHPKPASSEPPACGFVWSDSSAPPGGSQRQVGGIAYFVMPCHPDDQPCDRTYPHAHGRCACGKLIQDDLRFRAAMEALRSEIA